MFFPHLFKILQQKRTGFHADSPANPSPYNGVILPLTVVHLMLSCLIYVPPISMCLLFVLSKVHLPLSLFYKLQVDYAPFQVLSLCLATLVPVLFVVRAAYCFLSSAAFTAGSWLFLGLLCLPSSSFSTLAHP